MELLEQGTSTGACIIIRSTSLRDTPEAPLGRLCTRVQRECCGVFMQLGEPMLCLPEIPCKLDHHERSKARMSPFCRCLCRHGRQEWTPNTLPQAYSSGSEVRCCCDVCRPQMLQCYMDEAVTATLTVQLVRGLFIGLLIVMTAVVHGCCGPSVA